MSAMILVTDLLDAMEGNIRAFIKLAGKVPGTIQCIPDASTGTASVHHETIGETIIATVRFPVLPAATRLSRDEADRWIGYALHELCHALYTSDHAWREACRERIVNLVNGLEDVRIERAAIKAAFATNFQDVLTSLLSFVLTRTGNLAGDTGAGAGRHDPNDLRQLPFTLAVIGRVRLCGYDLPVGRAMVARMNPWTRALVDGALDRLDVATSTFDVNDIARWIKAQIAELRAQAQQPKPQPKPMPVPLDDEPEADDVDDVEQTDTLVEGDKPETSDEPSSDDDSDKPAASGPAASDADEPEADADEPEADADEPEADADEPEADADEPAASGGSTSDDEPEADADEPEADADEPEADADEPVKGEHVDGGAGDSNSGDSDMAATLDDDDKPEPVYVDDMERVDLNPLGDASREAHKAMDDGGIEVDVQNAIRDAQHKASRKVKAFTEQKTSVLTVPVVAGANRAGRLKAQVARVLKAEEMEDWDHGRPSGRIDRHAVARIGAGVVDNVYSKRTIAGGYETEISVLVDGSSSMGYSPGSTTKMQGAAILALALAQAAQQVGVRCDVLMFQSPGGLRVVKDERTTASAALAAFGLLSRAQRGTTPLTSSMIKATARLAARAPLKRKIVFVVSDGECDNGAAGVRKACDYAKRLDVETVALCVDTPPHAGFDMAVQCSSSDIAAAGLGALLKALSLNV